MRAWISAIVLSLILNTAFAPLAAVAAQKQILENGRLDVPAFEEKLSTTVRGLVDAGWILEDGKHHSLSVESLLAAGAQDFFVTPPEGDYSFRFKSATTNQALIRFAVVATDRKGEKVLSRRMLELRRDAKDEVEAKLQLEQTLRSLENDLLKHTQASVGTESFWQRALGLVIPTAHAAPLGKVIVHRTMQAALVLGFSGLLALTLGLINPFKGKGPTVVVVTAWSSLLLIIASFVIDYNVNGVVPPQRDSEIKDR